jgi:DNA-binding helix-hairpin-helix protein with protein kinase domain
MSTPAVRDSKGPVHLGKLLGKGGEGSVYEIAGDQARVAKIYHDPAAAAGKAAKIDAMVSLGNDRLLSLAAWPLDSLKTARGDAVGLVLPMVAGHKDIHTLYSPRSRKAEFPAADWRFLVRVAANTARAFAAIHETGCVIGDVNHGGIRVSDKATVRLIDCDSFQVVSGGQRFLCEVGVPTFTPPELQGKPFRGVVRTADHDNFGLAVLVFHLLYMGRHPFAGRFLGRGDMGIEQAITEFRFAYGANRAAAQMEPPPNVPPISIASQPVAALIERAFSQTGTRPGGRPAAKEWVGALAQLEGMVRTCGVNASHHYLNSLQQCPWCHLESATGVVLFNAVVPSGRQGGGSGHEELWSRIVAVPSPGYAAALPTWSDVTASPEALQLRRWRRKERLATFGAVPAALAAMLYFHEPAAFGLCLVGYVVWLILRSAVVIGTQNAPFEKAAKEASDRWTDIRNQWDHIATDDRFKAQYHKLEREYAELKKLPAVRQSRYQKLEQGRAQQQRMRHLESFEIERAKISGLGPSRKAMLASYNIETAWDVEKHRVMAVPGFGPARADKLVEWRRSVEARFRFDPARGVDPRDIAALDREIAAVRFKLEQSLANGPQVLKRIREHLLAQRAQLRPQVEIFGKEDQESKIDLSII